MSRVAKQPINLPKGVELGVSRSGLGFYPSFGRDTNRLELAIHKTSQGAGAVFVHALQQAGFLRMRLVVGKGLALQIGSHALPACGSVHRRKAGRKRLKRRAAAQFQYLLSFEQQLNRTAQPRPELHLPGDGTFHGFPGKPGIQNECVRKFYGLAHGLYGSITLPGLEASSKDDELAGFRECLHAGHPGKRDGGMEQADASGSGGGRKPRAVHNGSKRFQVIRRKACKLLINWLLR